MPDAFTLRLLISLAAGALAGALSMWVFGRFTNQEQIRLRRNLVQARVMELRLYRDEPRVILRALRAILAGNARLVLMVMKPLAVLLIPLALATIHLDAWLGMAPLPVGVPALLTVRLAAPPPLVTLTAPDSIVVETPPVHLDGDRELVWRIRPQASGAAVLRITAGNMEATKSIVTGSGFAYLTPARERSLLAWLVTPFQPRLPAGPIESIQLSYPSIDLPFLGFEWNWLVWFLLASLPAALLAKALLGIRM